MRLAVYQPQYFPRLHYLHRALDSDIFVIADYLQYVRAHTYHLPDGRTQRGKSFQAHAPIKLAQALYELALPLHGKFLPINQTRLVDQEAWRHSHLRTVASAYGRAPYFSNHFPDIKRILRQKYPSLADLNIMTTFWAITRLLTDESTEIDSLIVERVNALLAGRHPFRLKKIIIASQTEVPPPVKGKANEWLIKLARHLDADEYYYGGTAQASYMDPTKFAQAGIRTVLQNWQCTAYHQQFMPLGFLPNLSIIDLVLNEDLGGRQRVLKGEGNEQQTVQNQNVSVGQPLGIKHP